MKRTSRRNHPASRRSYRASLAVLLALAAFSFLGACGGSESPDSAGPPSPPEQTQANGEVSAMPSDMEQTAAAEEQALTPAEATVGPEEESSMMPAGGREPDPEQPPPEDPPEGVETFPATTNKIVDGPIEYARTPPTNGDHAPLWQNCGFYSEPIDDVNAVHSMDHGVVWITYRPDLSAEQVRTLRPYGGERYVIISPYPGQDAPVIATSWRNQLKLEDANDPRLRQFVDQFRVTSTAPLSGNGCTGGVGEPEPS